MRITIVEFAESVITANDNSEFSRSRRGSIGRVRESGQCDDKTRIKKKKKKKEKKEEKKEKSSSTSLKGTSRETISIQCTKELNLKVINIADDAAIFSRSTDNNLPTS